MAKKRKRVGDWVPLFTEIPPPLKAKLEARAARARRSTTSELIVILESVLADEPEPVAKAIPAKSKKPKTGKD